MALVLSEPVDVRGWGIHSGQPAKVRLNPCAHGVWLRAPGSHERVELTQSMYRGVRKGSVLLTPFGDIAGPEHLFGALALLELRAVEIECRVPSEWPNDPEMAESFVDALAPYLLPTEETVVLPVRAGVNFVENGREYVMRAAKEPYLEVTVSVRGQRHTESFRRPDCAPERLAWALGIGRARTWVLRHELDASRLVGLCAGLERTNCRVLDEGRIGTADLVECAAHKALDFLGDTYLLGATFDCGIHLLRPNHATTATWVQRLLEAKS